MLQTKKGGIVVLIGFTGIRLSEVTCTVATKTEIHTMKKDGTTMIFDRKTGMQTNCVEGKEKYANKIVDIADAPPAKAKKVPADKKAPAKKAAKAKVEVVEEVEEEFEEEATPAPKAKAKKKTKKAPVVVVEEDEDFDDEDEYEEV